MGYGVRLHIWGDRACFTRPEMKGERVSYDVITPSAARGILEAIHWKPAIRWQVDRIHVLKPIGVMKWAARFLSTTSVLHKRGGQQRGWLTTWKKTASSAP